MKIKIIDYKENKVTVKSKYGRFKAIWCSLDCPRSCFVELDCDDIITLQSITIVAHAAYIIEQCNQETYITGYVEEIEDGVLIMRVGPSLLMLKLSSEYDFVNFKQNYVKVKLHNIKLYDIGI